MGPRGETHGRPTKLVIPFCGPIDRITLLVRGGIGGGEGICTGPVGYRDFPQNMSGGGRIGDLHCCGGFPTFSANYVGVGN